MSKIWISNKSCYVIVDKKDYPILVKYHWHINPMGYVVRFIKRTAIYMHRQILNASKGLDVHHIDNNKLNNKQCNLELCSRIKHCGYSSSRGGSSKYKGVFWRKDTKKWQVHFRHKSYGCYDNEKEASIIYNKISFNYYSKLN